MGLGDEIMALGRAERKHEETGKPVSIISMTGSPRENDSWIGNPAWALKSEIKIIDGGGARPYIKHWNGRQSIFNHDYRARAGRIYLTEAERNFGLPNDEPFAIVAPFLKKEASPNKDWGFKNWEKVIEDFPIQVFQLCQTHNEQLIKGAKRLLTPSFRMAYSVIERAALVMCNEGGTHHMAASAKTPAVVVFGSFVPPYVTGYNFHYNIAVETNHGYCGNWDKCKDCRTALDSISPEFVREKAILLWESYNAD